MKKKETIVKEKSFGGRFFFLGTMGKTPFYAGGAEFFATT